MMSFALGKPVLAMLALSLVTGGVLALRPAGDEGQNRGDQTIWVFAEAHARIYNEAPAGHASVVGQYEAKTHRRVRVELLAQRALDVRLLSLFMSPQTQRDVPDLVEVEIGSIGKFFRPPLPDVGFVPLNHYLQRDGLRGRLLESRFAPWTKQGVIFGIPHDVHPVSLTYRRDLFDAAGVDLGSAATWADFQNKCLAYQRYWTAHGLPHRRAMELHRTSADDLVVMLLQRHVNLVDDRSRLHLTDPVVARTLAFYAQLVAGPGRIGADSSPGVLWTHDLGRGDFGACFTPDWRISALRDYSPELAGKLAMMPLPRFEPGDAPTSTWGGTMIGIPRQCRDPEAAWALLKLLYFSPAGLEARRRYSDILPPDRAQWQSPVYHRADPFFGGQKVMGLYVTLAEAIPRRYVTPFSALATSYLSAVLARAVDRVEQRGAEGLEGQCAAWLAEAQGALRERMDFGTFETETRDE
jgi:arabinosaccharide transport system substrate-binding protein